MLLGAMLSSAVESRVIRSNPTAGIKASRKNSSRAKQALTEVEALAAAATEYSVLVLVLAYCGLRSTRRSPCAGTTATTSASWLWKRGSWRSGESSTTRTARRTAPGWCPFPDRLPRSWRACSPAAPARRP